MTPISDAGELVAAIRAAGLLESTQERVLTARAGRAPGRAAELAADLVGRGWLTSYQADEALNGRAAGLVLGSYQLLEPLGAGGMGQVFKARHRLMGRLVALKLIRPELLTDPAMARRFRRETRLAARLSHPNVVVAHDAQEVDGRHFLVMEYVAGTTLAQLVRQAGPLPVDRACGYVRQAALGLAHVHKRGLIHRDLKPENLLVADAVVKVVDFGLARLGADSVPGAAATQAGRIVGTADYLAPEQARDAHAVDARADLYSLGGTLYFALSGQVPFPGGTALEKLLRHRLEEPQPLAQLRPDVPAELGAVVARLMAKQPADRYPSAQTVANALAPWCRPPPPGNGPAPEVVGSTGSLAPSVPVHWPPDPANGQKSSLSTAVDRPNVDGRRCMRRRVLIAAGLAAAGLTAAGLALLPRGWRQGWQAGSVFEPMPDEVGGMAVSPDGRYVALACGNPARPQNPGTIGLVDLSAGRFWTLGTHPCSARRVVFTPDGGTLISATGTNHSRQRLIGELRFWDVQRRAERKGRHIPDASGAGIRDMAMDQGGKWLALVGLDLVVRLRDIATGQAELRFEYRFATVYTAVALSPDAGLLAAGTSDGQVRLWRVADQREACSPLIAAERAAVTGLAFRPGGQLVGVTGMPPEGEAQISVWDLDDYRLAYRLVHGKEGVHGLALAADGRTIATACQDRIVRVWDLAERQLVQELPGHMDAVYAVAFAADGRLLASAGSDRAVRLWTLDA